MASENIGTIAQAYVQIMPSAQGMKGSLASVMGGEAESAGKSAGGSFAGAFGKATKALGSAAVAGFDAVLSGSVALGKAIVTQTGELAAYGDNIDKMSQKMGISAEAYQEWDAILQHSGSSIDAMLPSMKSLAVAAEGTSKEAAAAFDAIGLSQEAIASMSQEQLFESTISGLQGVSDETERMYLASRLLGRGATELGPLLNTSAQDVEAMRQRVHELGGVMSNEAVKASAAYQDTLQDMQTAFSGVQRSLVVEFLPDVTGVMKGVTALFTGDSDEGIAQIVAGVQSLSNKLIDHAPELAEAGVQLVIALATAIIQSIPKLVLAVPQILGAVVRGLLNGTKDIRSAGSHLMDNLKNAFLDKVAQARQWGRDLIQNFIDGILAKFESLKNTVRGAAQTVKDFLGFSEPSQGPLSDFHTYAPDMVDLWNEGIRSKESDLRRQLSQSFDLRPAIMSAATSAAPAPAEASGGLPSVVNLTALFELDGEILARKQYSFSMNEITRHGVSLVNA